MKADVKYFGRVYEYVTYTATVTLGTPVDVNDIITAKELAESTLIRQFPGYTQLKGAQVHSTFQHSIIHVIAEVTVPECVDCGCTGHLSCGK